MNTLLKISSTFANLLMEKPDNSFTVVKTWKKHLKKKHFKKRICIYTWKFSLGQFSVPACANQPRGFCVRGKSTPNGLFQTIGGLKNISGLHQMTPSTKRYINVNIYIYIYTYIYTYVSPLIFYVWMLQ